jgi:uncharacterized membrane protein
MNKNRIIFQVSGLALTIGSFIMSIIYLLVDWNVCSINLPKLSFNFWLIPMWIGIMIYQYRPTFSMTTKRLSWASIALFGISILTMCLSHGSKIFQAAEIVFSISGFLSIIAWAKMYRELMFLDKEEEEDEKN